MPLATAETTLRQQWAQDGKGVSVLPTDQRAMVEDVADQTRKN